MRFYIYDEFVIEISDTSYITDDIWEQIKHLPKQDLKVTVSILRTFSQHSCKVII